MSKAREIVQELTPLLEQKVEEILAREQPEAEKPLVYKETENFRPNPIRVGNCYFLSLGNERAESRLRGIKLRLATTLKNHELGPPPTLELCQEFFLDYDYPDEQRPVFRQAMETNPLAIQAGSFRFEKWAEYLQKNGKGYRIDGRWEVASAARSRADRSLVTLNPKFSHDHELNFGLTYFWYSELALAYTEMLLETSVVEFEEQTQEFLEKVYTGRYRYSDVYLDFYHQAIEVPHLNVMYFIEEIPGPEELRLLMEFVSIQRPLVHPNVLM